MNNKVAVELLRDFFMMLGPKRPVELYDFNVSLMDGSESDSHVLSFNLPEDLKKGLKIDSNVLPLSANDLENLILSRMTSESGVNERLMKITEFLKALPQFKSKIDSYFEKQKICIIFEFK